MIHYRLRCAGDHEFEGWFRDSAAFEQQEAAGLLSCPSCASTAISRGLMAPAVRTAGAARAGASPPEQGEVTVMPDAVRAGLQRLRAAIERECENLGDRFADEAIRMRHGAAETRGIYGTTTARDRDALADAGVEVMAIPWLKPADG